jgi:hypothetical protein
MIFSMLMPKYNMFDIPAVSLNFYYSEFYFVYLFSAAIYRFYLELCKYLIMI